MPENDKWRVSVMKKILYSKPLTIRTTEIPHDFAVLISEAELSAKYEHSTFGFIASIKPQLVLLFLLLRNIHKYDIVVTGRYGLLFLLFQLLIPLRYPYHIITDVEFKKTPQDSFSSKLITKIKQLILNKATRVSVFCEQEAINYSKAFNIDINKFFYLPYCSELTQNVDISDGGYIFTGGLHDRDYATLFSALRDTTIPVKIAAPVEHFSRMDLPNNITITGLISKKEYVKLIANSRMVVLSLESNTLRYPGVITYVYAMSLGKCTIVNDPLGAKSYITHGINGLLCNPHNPSQLSEIISMYWSDHESRTRIGINAREHITNHFQFKNYFNILRSTINDVLHGKNI